MIMCVLTVLLFYTHHNGNTNQYVTMNTIITMIPLTVFLSTI